MNKVEQLTSQPWGHTLHHNRVFSDDGSLLVFDARNEDAKIAETGGIGVLDLTTLAERAVYVVPNQSKFGPGVGAASFAPNRNEIVFIHGLKEANAQQPYTMSRRTGMLVNIDSRSAYYADSRDCYAPYRAGSLRGGTHSHAWSMDGAKLSFTYNDDFVEPELRTVGVMINGYSVNVDAKPNNVSGSYYAAIVTDVVKEPHPDTDQINKAFDECWINATSRNGLSYDWIAYQGNTLRSNGAVVTEIYAVEIDEQLILHDKTAVGMEGERPKMPHGMKFRRLTRTENGLSDLRHWLRSSADGQYIYALAKDDLGRNQLMRCEFDSGKSELISNFDFSISSPINLNSRGSQVTFLANNQVYVYDFLFGELLQVTSFAEHDLPVVGAPHFSTDDSFLVFNQYVKGKDGVFLQIMRVML